MHRESWAVCIGVCGHVEHRLLVTGHLRLWQVTRSACSGSQWTWSGAQRDQRALMNTAAAHVYQTQLWPRAVPGIQTSLTNTGDTERLPPILSHWQQQLTTRTQATRSHQHHCDKYLLQVVGRQEVYILNLVEIFQKNLRLT